MENDSINGSLSDTTLDNDKKEQFKKDCSQVVTDVKNKKGEGPKTQVAVFETEEEEYLLVCKKKNSGADSGGKGTRPIKKRKTTLERIMELNLDEGVKNNLLKEYALKKIRLYHLKDILFAAIKSGLEDLEPDVQQILVDTIIYNRDNLYQHNVEDVGVYEIKAGDVDDKKAQKWCDRVVDLAEKICLRLKIANKDLVLRLDDAHRETLTKHLNILTNQLNSKL